MISTAGILTDVSNMAVVRSIRDERTPLIITTVMSILRPCRQCGKDFDARACHTGRGSLPLSTANQRRTGDGVIISARHDRTLCATRAGRRVLHAAAVPRATCAVLGDSETFPLTPQRRVIIALPLPPLFAIMKP
jgi:hypothetical protein